MVPIPAEPARVNAAPDIGTAETMRLSLDFLDSAKAADDLLRLKGRVYLSIDLKELRRDRR